MLLLIYPTESQLIRPPVVGHAFREIPSLSAAVLAAPREAPFLHDCGDGPGLFQAAVSCI